MEDWFFKVGLVEKLEKVNSHKHKKYFDEILSYRNLLKKTFITYVEEQKGLDALVEKTNYILLKNKVHPQIKYTNGTNKLEFSNKETDSNLLLTLIVIEVAKLLSSYEFKYLKKCNNHTCSLTFIDTSKNHSRRWCSMESCGNRAKVKRFSTRNK